MVSCELPKKLHALRQPARYKIVYGGRGSAKSWGVARLLLLDAIQKPQLILCAREIQKSIRESSKRLLESQIRILGLTKYCQIQREYLKVGKSEIIFAGLRHNIDNIKSLEGANRVWIEEGNNTSKQTWNKLDPTVRAEDSEIWVTYNPELDSDFIHQRFVVQDPPSNAIVVKMGWQDNPWFPSVLKDQMNAMRDTDPDEYLHVWEGHTRRVLEGAIFGNELRECEREGRIGRVPVDKRFPVNTFWDLGWRDCTSIWLMQKIGQEIRLVHFVQGAHRTLESYVSELTAWGTAKGITWGKDFLPFDGGHDNIRGENPVSQLKRLGRNAVAPRAASPKVTQHDCARNMFPRVWFDQESCFDGLNALRQYRYDPDSPGRQSPLHDINSHAADAFLTMAIEMSIVKPARKLPETTGDWLDNIGFAPDNTSWMGV